MKLNSKLLLFLLCCSTIIAQEIKVINTFTDEPIYGAVIYNTKKTKITRTNINGKASLKGFQKSDTIHFEYLSQVLKSITVSKALVQQRIYLEASTQDLREIIISASKFGQQKNDISQKVVNIDAKTIAFYNPQTSADALQQTGSVFVQKSQLGGGSPIIRGFSTNRLLITVDGVRMNTAIFRSGNLHNVISIDPLTIENTEVILGAGSVIYGSDAIGGVMSFYTKAPHLSAKDTLSFRTNALVRYASASNEKTGHFDINLGLKRWGFLTSVTYTDFDDLKAGSNGLDDYLRPDFITSSNGNDVIVNNSDPKIQKFTGYNQFNATQRIAFKPNRHLNFDLGLHYSTSSNIPRYDRLLRRRSNGELRSAEWDYGPQNWFMANLQVTKTNNYSALFDNLKITSAYQNFQESRIDRDFQSVDRRIREESVNAYSLNIDFDNSLSQTSTLFYGAEYILNKVSSTGTIENISTNQLIPTVSRYPDGATWSSLALYSSFKYKPNTKFILQSGMRYNLVNTRADFTANNAFLNLPFNTANTSANALTGTAGISWFPNPILQCKFNLGSAFRAPNIDDIGKVFDSEPGAVVVPNNNLKPEYAVGGEFGFTVNLNKNVIIDFSTYYTFLDDALVRQDATLNGENEIEFDGAPSTVQSIQNASNSRIYGFESGVVVNINKYLKLSSQYSIVRGNEDRDGEKVPVRHVSPSFGNTHLTWAKKRFKADAFLNYNGTLDFNELAPSERSKNFIYALDANGNPFSPSWYTLNLRTRYKLSSSTVLTATLENITDQLYRPYSSGISAPGRNIILALHYKL